MRAIYQAHSAIQCDIPGTLFSVWSREIEGTEKERWEREVVEREVRDRGQRERYGYQAVREKKLIWK